MSLEVPVHCCGQHITPVVLAYITVANDTDVDGHKFGALCEDCSVAYQGEGIPPLAADVDKTLAKLKKKRKHPK